MALHNDVWHGFIRSVGLNLYARPASQQQYLRANDIFERLRQTEYNPIRADSVLLSVRPELIQKSVLYNLPACLNSDAVLHYDVNTQLFSIGPLPDICRHGVSCDTGSIITCPRIHICKRFLLRCCPHGERCTGVHDIFHDKNQTLLKKHYLHQCSRELLHELYLSEHRPGMLRPKLCTFYSKGTCDNATCKYLHLCYRYLISRDCIYGNRCKRSHNVYEVRNADILQYYAFNTSLPASKVEDLLRKWESPKVVTQKVCRYYLNGECSKRGACPFLHVCPNHAPGRCTGGDACRQSNRDDDDYDPPNQFLDDHSQRFPAEENRQPVSPAARQPVSRRLRSSSAGRLNHKRQETTELCWHYLRDKCKFGKMCKSVHSESNYQWQYCKGSGREWMNFSAEVNDQLEDAFSKPENAAGRVYLAGQYLPVQFVRMAKDGVIANEQGYSFRRLGTKSYAEKGAGCPFVTNWHWYQRRGDNAWTSMKMAGYDDAVTQKSFEESYLRHISGITHTPLCPVKVGENMVTTINTDTWVAALSDGKYWIRRRPLRDASGPDSQESSDDNNADPYQSEDDLGAVGGRPPPTDYSQENVRPKAITEEKVHRMSPPQWLNDLTNSKSSMSKHGSTRSANARGARTERDERWPKNNFMDGARKHKK